MQSSSDSEDPHIEVLNDLITSDTVVVFDLDDTLYKEIDFVDSGFRYVLDQLELSEDLVESMHIWLKNGEPVFELLRQGQDKATQFSEAKLVEMYRNHSPKISIDCNTKEALDQIQKRAVGLAMITDGRSRTQRNKIAALGLGDYFDLIVISDETGHSKPELHNFEQVMDHFGRGCKFLYMADNPAKDFVAPNRLGWTTVMLEDDGRNIHSQHRIPTLECGAAIRVQSVQSLLR